MADIVMKKGLAVNLPTEALDNVLLFTTDTGEIFKGNGIGNALTKYCDVLSYDAAASFPVTGLVGKLYVDKAVSAVYVWAGSYVNIGHTHANKAVLDLLTTVTAETKTTPAYNGEALAFLAETNTKLGAKADLVDGVVPLSQLPNEVKETRVVQTIAARDLIANPYSGLFAWVVDATGDASVTSGAALYIHNGTAWSKAAEAESLDLDLSVYMAVASYDSNADGKVNSADSADSAVKVAGVDTAAASTYYGQNAAGNVGFHALPVVSWGSF
jgi:hypothetical protein